MIGKSANPYYRALDIVWTAEIKLDFDAHPDPLALRFPGYLAAVHTEYGRPRYQRVRPAKNAGYALHGVNFGEQERHARAACRLFHGLSHAGRYRVISTHNGIQGWHFPAIARQLQQSGACAV
jgi:hypothetical protein